MNEATNILFFFLLMVGVGLLLIALAYGVHRRREKKRREYTDPMTDRHYHYKRREMVAQGEGFDEKVHSGERRHRKHRSHHHHHHHDSENTVF